ncbi:hypothetical protein EDC01DRAFT_783383 [Geopyxis carbonaria]|nr:hypothetical protein EDC01DRAFT_783383 [Geopyxis carbonaria]
MKPHSRAAAAAPTPPTPIITLTIHHRVSRRKFPITHPSAPLSPRYYILSPPSWRLPRTHKKSAPLHADKWLAVVHGGGNPKYTAAAASPVVGLVTRTTWWRRVAHSVGPGAAATVDAMRRERAWKRYREGVFWRRVLRRGRGGEFVWEGDGDKGEGQKEAGQEAGRQVDCEMVHEGHRRYGVVVDGVDYVLTGTTRYGGPKGCGRSVKLCRRADGRLVAALHRTSKGACEKAVEETLGKRFGYVEIFDGGLEEALVVQLLWSMVEAEHRKREVVLDVLLEIADNAG